MIRNKPPEIYATFLILCSKDFLEPYSLVELIPPMLNHSHHLGDISITVVANTIPDIISNAFNTVIIEIINYKL
jgi:hypothetical protein